MANANALDRLILAVAPKWGADRIRSRAIADTLARHYEAAQGGRRTQHWGKRHTDANTANGPALANLRALSRDLVRNNAWARNALRVISANTVGWGIVPKPKTDKAFAARWKAWAESTECDAAGRLNFYGLQKLAMRTIVESGEVLVRRRWRKPEDGLPLPMVLQVLEPDFLDTNKDNETGIEKGPIIQGVEFDAIGRRVAYWLFDEHPGSARQPSASKRVSAENVIHVFDMERPGQVRGASWLASAIVSLRDFDEYEDASLVAAKIAACYSVAITDVDGDGAPLGTQDASTPGIETLEPGMILRLKPGQDFKTGTPPVAADNGFSTRTLRRIAAAIGVTYEDLTGDYSQVNYSSGRMGWHRHWQLVEDWRWNMLVPGFCDPAWSWAMEAAKWAGYVKEVSGAEWTPPPRPMLDPDKEGLAATRRVRSGQASLYEVIREQGRDPEAHLAEIAEGNAKLDELGIVLDSDPRKMTQSGQAQAEAKPEAPPDAKPDTEKPEADEKGEG